MAQTPNQQVSTAGKRKPKGGQAKVFGLTTTGTQDSAKVLDSIGGRGADARPAWPAIFKLMQADTKARFDHEGEGDWPRLATETIETKARKNQDARLMRASGALYKSLTGDRGKGALRRKSRYQMRYGTTLFYARFHQEGKGVPKRPLIDVDRQLEKHVVDALESYVAKGEIPERLQKGRGAF